MKRIYKILIGIAVFALVVWLVSLNAGAPAKNIRYGYTFSEPYAKSLGLDWKAAYISGLDDLKPQYIRLSAYWDEVQKQQDKYSFDDFDFQVSEASRRNVKIILAVGRRLPRWPECHDPSWISGIKSQAELDNAQLSYEEAVVNRYSSDPNIAIWQVENEPYLSTFGICPKLDKNLLSSEIALVKKLDPSRPVLVTHSGELDFWLANSGGGDIFGSTFYRYVYSDVFKRYWTNFYFLPVVYRFKAGLMHLLHPGKPIMIAELEAEPWTTAGIPNTPIDQQFQTMSLDHFKTITSLSAATGFSPQLLWGEEWWYYMKGKGHLEFWEAARELMENK